MTFEEILDAVLAMVQRRGRVTDRALKRPFTLDDDAFEDLTDALLYAHPHVVDDDGRGLVWTGEGRPTPTPGSPPAIDQARAPLAYTPPYLAEKILTSKRVLEGERKHVTVLFADLKGSMELLADRDPEEARQLLDPVLTLMMDAVHRYEGTVNQVMGDGIMALFGAPVAHEDHAVRACYAALAMQDAIGRYREEVRRTHSIEVHIRVGLNSGAVVVRAIDSSLHMDYTAVGQTTHLAARMEQLALPGSIRLTVETLRLAEGFIEVKALAYARQAGEKAMARSAHREAVGSFKQALSALAHLPETRDTHEQAIDLRLALRTALYPSGDAGRILAVLRQAEALAEALDDHHRLGQVLLFLSNHFYHGGAYDQAIAAGQRVLAFATAGRDAVLHARANNYLGLAYLAQTDYRQAIDCFGQTVAALDGARRHERFGQANLPAVISRANLAWCHAELGMFAEGRALGDEGLRIAEAVAHPASLMVAYYGIGLRSLLQGDLPEALPRLERAVGICQDADLPGWFPRMAAPLGAAYTLAGRVADAVPLLTQALAQTTARERGDFQALCRLPRGEVQLLAGHLEEAPTLAKRALTHARAHQEHGHQAYALRLLGEIAARREPPETALAEAHYHQALALAEALGMRPLVAHYHRGFGTLYAKIGHRAKARAALSAAAELYRAMAMTCWLPQAETALAEVEGH